MSQWPIIAGPSYGVGLATITSSRGAAITASATVNTKGAWAQIIASTAEHYQALIVSLKGAQAAINRSLIDIGIGATGSEVVLIPDLRVMQGSTLTRAYIHPYMVPIGVVSGTAISARAASSVASAVIHVQVIGIPAGMQFKPAFFQINHYGINSATSGGTAVDCGATANTKGAYAALTASTANPIKMFFVIITASNTGNPVTGADATVDVSIGAAAAEQVICPDLPYAWGSDASAVAGRPAIYGPFYCDIPTATRIAARAQGSGTDATGRVFDVSMLAFW